MIATGLNNCFRNILFTCTILLFFILFNHISAQNLAPNPGFEFYVDCPINYNIDQSLECEPWICADANGTCDYFNECVVTPNVDIPSNIFGYQYALDGEGYCGFFAKHTNFAGDYREYLQAPLLSPLESGHVYHVSFYINLANFYCGIQLVGAYFSNSPPVTDGGHPLTVVPQIETSGGFLSDTLNWMLVEGCFVAFGGEDYITIGNFHPNSTTPIDPMCGVNGQPISYYLIDVVTVEEIDGGQIDFDLGPPVTSCDSYTIDPGLGDIHYLWEDGSTDPTLTVSESGTYTLTIYDGCDTGEDSIEVEIINNLPVELNPDEVTICPGDQITFSLDPLLGTYTWSDGTESPDYTISTEGTFSVTFDDGCDVSSDAIIVHVLQPPSPFSLGIDTILCEGTFIDYSFDPDLGAFLWSDNSTSSVYSIGIAGEYALTISNMCGEESSSIEIEPAYVPVINLGPPEEILCNGDFIDFSLDPSLGEYVWQDGSTALNYHINTTGLYSVTVSNACGEDEDSIHIIALPAPDFELGNSISGCPGDTFILSANIPMGMYAWQDGSVNDSFLVTSSGMYVLHISNACGSHTDTLNATFASAIVQPSLGPDIDLCPGESIILSSGNNGVNTLWQDLSTADTFLVNAPGVYYVTVSNTCFTLSDSVTVGMNNQPPDLILPDTINLCQGETSLIDAVITGVNYEWNDHSQNQTLLVSSPGIYSLTVTNACGSDADTVVVKDGGFAPTVNLGSDLSICPDESISLTPIFSNVDQWLWSDGSSGDEYMIQDSGTVTIIADNSCGRAYDTLYVDLLEAIPELELGNDTSLCDGESFFLTINIQNVSISWQDGSSNASFIIDHPGEVIGTITNVCGTSVDTIHVEGLEPISVLDLGPDLPLCPGEQIVLDPGIEDVEYLWSDGSVSDTLLVDHDQSVSLTITNACGTSVDNVLIFTSTNGPDVDLGADILVCEGTVVNINTNISRVNYVWQDGSTNDSYTTTQSGEFYVDVSNSCGVDSDTIYVDIHGIAPQVNLGADTLLCEGEVLILQTSPDDETIITWQDGSTIPTYLINTAGIYSVYETNRCGEAGDTIEIAYQRLPSPFDLGTDTTLCKGDTVILHIPPTTDLIAWKDGSHLDSFIVTQTGTYGLTISNDCGMEQDEIQIIYTDESIRIPFVEPADICPGDVIPLDVTQSFDAFYLWSTGASSGEINISLPGTYFVTITSPCQSAEGKFDVFESETCKSHNDFYIPNVISPNEDKVNDVFTIYPGENVEMISMNGSIFDRWGDLVYSSNENPFVWDGNFKNAKVMPGVYLYVVKVEYNLNGEVVKEVFKGDVTVVR